MNPLHSLLVFTVFCSIVGCGDAGRQRPGFSGRLDSIAVHHIDNGPIAGLAIAVAEAGQLIFERGYGVSNIETNAPVTAGSVFNIASTGKIVAAITMLTLVDDARVSLDDDLATLLPAFSNPDQGRLITLGHLFSMTSGLNDYVAADIERWAASREPLSPAFVLDHVRDRPLDFPPGTNWIYSNTGFYLGGLIVEEITRRPWADYVMDVVRELGLTETHICDRVADIRTRGYELLGGRLVPSVFDAEQGVRGDAGLCSSARDLARVPTLLEDSDVLSDSLRELMLSPTVLTNGVQVDYGLGVARGEFAGQRMWGHLGGAGSIVATLAHYPDNDITIAVLVNTRGASVGALVVEGDVAQAVFDIPEPQLIDQPVLKSQRSSYEGTYVGDRSNTTYRIVMDESRLVRVGEFDSNSTVALLQQSPNVFGRADWPFDRLVFQASGETVAFSMYLNGFFDGLYVRRGRN